MKKIIFASLLVFGFIVAYPIFADSTTTTTTTTTNSSSICSKANMSSVEGIINWATCLLVKSVVPLLFALALVAFIWGVIQYYINPDNEEKRKKGKSFIIGGIIALFVMTSVWGIVTILRTTFKVDGNNILTNPPTIKVD